MAYFIDIFVMYMCMWTRLTLSPIFQCIDFIMQVVWNFAPRYFLHSLRLSSLVIVDLIVSLSVTFSLQLFTRFYVNISFNENILLESMWCVFSAYVAGDFEASLSLLLRMQHVINSNFSTLMSAGTSCFREYSTLVYLEQCLFESYIIT